MSLLWWVCLIPHNNTCSPPCLNPSLSRPATPNTARHAADHVWAVLHHVMMRTDTHPGTYVSLLVAYRGFLGLELIYMAYTDPRYRHHPTLYVATAVHVGMYAVFLADRKCRCAALFCLLCAP